MLARLALISLVLAASVGCAHTADGPPSPPPEVGPAPTADGPPAPAPEVGPKTLTIEHYAIALPAGYRAMTAPAMEDFDFWQIRRTKDDRIVCGLYFGGWPQFPDPRWTGKPAEIIGQGRITKRFESPRTIEGLIEFTGLTYKKQPYSPFPKIHYFGDDLDESARADMLRMIDSIEVVKPHLD